MRSAKGYLRVSSSFAAGTFKARAILTMFLNEMFVSPLSTAPMNVRCRAAFSASTS